MQVATLHYMAEYGAEIWRTEFGSWSFFVYCGDERIGSGASMPSRDHALCEARFAAREHRVQHGERVRVPLELD